MTAILLLAALQACTRPDSIPADPLTESRDSSLAALDIRFSWNDAPHRIDLAGEGVFRKLRAVVAEDDPYKIRLEFTADPGVDSWVFRTRRLTRKDVIGDTIENWAVIVRVPAGLSNRDLNGQEVELSIAAEWSIPPVQRRNVKVRCTVRRYQPELIELRLPLDEDILAEGTLHLRHFNP